MKIQKDPPREIATQSDTESGSVRERDRERRGRQRRQRKRKKKRHREKDSQKKELDGWRGETEIAKDRVRRGERTQMGSTQEAQGQTHSQAEAERGSRELHKDRQPQDPETLSWETWGSQSAWGSSPTGGGLTRAMLLPPVPKA